MATILSHGLGTFSGQRVGIPAGHCLLCRADCAFCFRHSRPSPHWLVLTCGAPLALGNVHHRLRGRNSSKKAETFG
jgi:hypothetical protein